MASSAAVHRPIRLTSPHMTGDDIKVIQRLDGVDVNPDGDYGAETRAAVRAKLYRMGAAVGYFDANGLTEEYQRILRGKRRPATWIARARSRKDAAERAADGPSKAVGWYRENIGVSNRYKNPVLQWEKEAGYGPVPWCGVAAIKAMRVGGLTIQNSWGFGYVPNILNAGRDGRYGFRVVTNPQPGDLIIYKWPGVSRDIADHVGMVETVEANGRVCDASLEGNTSGTSGGSQHNGDSLQRKDRDGYGVVAYIRPPWGQ